MADTDLELARALKDAEFLRQAGGTPLNVMGGGARDPYGMSLGGRFSTRKQLANDVDLEGYLDAGLAKPKGMGVRGDISGGGVKLTKRFKKGGKVKPKSASSRADGIAQRGKTRGKMV